MTVARRGHAVTPNEAAFGWRRTRVLAAGRRWFIACDI